MGKRTRCRDGAGRLGLAAAFLVCLLVVGCGSDAEDLVIVNTEKEANRILVELVGRSINNARKVEKAQQRRTVWSIIVPKAQVEHARRILVDLDLPREDHGGFEAMLSQSSLIPTRTDERAKLMYAMAAELERTFEVYDRVVRARVHLVLPETDVLERSPTTKPVASAMVLIKYKQDMPVAGGGALPAAGNAQLAIRPIDEKQIKDMVARSVQGLKSEEVVVAYEPVSVQRQDEGSLNLKIVSLEAVNGQYKEERVQLAAITVGFGSGAIILVLLLVHEKRKTARQLAQR